MARSKGKKKKSKNKSAGEGVLTRAWRVALRLVHPGDGELDEDGDASRRKQEIKGLLMIGFSLFLLLAMATFYRPIDDPLADGHNLGG